MLVVTNLNQWLTKTKAQKEKVKASATEYVRKRVRIVLQDALRVSPQWSGDFASNWTVETHAYEGGRYQKYADKGVITRHDAKYAGHPEAIRHALQWSNDIINSLKWNSKIKLVNYAPVATKIESGQVKLRQVNKLPGGFVGVVAYLKAKYKYLE